MIWQPWIGRWSTAFAMVLVLSQAAVWSQEAASQPARQLAFSPDGRLLAAAFGELDQPGSLVVWEWRSGRPVCVHREDVGVATVSFAPNGNLLAIGMFGPAAKLISLETGHVLREFRGHSGHARSVAFTSDDVLATGSYDHTVRLWDVATADPIAKLGKHDDELRDIAASPDGKWLVTGARSPDARLWNVAERRQESKFAPSNLICPAVGFSRDGRFFFTGRWDATVRIRETVSQTLRAAIRVANRGFDLSPENRTLIVFDNNSPKLKRFDVALSPPTDELRQRIETLIATWHDDDYRKREDATRQLIELGLVAEPQLRRAMDSDSVEVRIRARRARAAVLSPEPEDLDVGHQADVRAVRFSPDGRFVASGDADGMVKVWEVRERNVIVDLQPESFARAEDPP